MYVLFICRTIFLIQNRVLGKFVSRYHFTPKLWTLLYVDFMGSKSNLFSVNCTKIAKSTYSKWTKSFLNLKVMCNNVLHDNFLSQSVNELIFYCSNQVSIQFLINWQQLSTRGRTIRLKSVWIRNDLKTDSKKFVYIEKCIFTVFIKSLHDFL